MRWKARVLISLSAAFLMTACAGSDGSSGVEVITREMKFTPSRLRIAEGRRTITVRNRGDLPHTFSLNTLGKEVTVQPGRTKTLTLNLRPGKYRYVCRILDHEGLGMHGELVVRAT